MPGQQSPSASPPGWYPDPWAPTLMRWWSGRDWTAYTAPVVGKRTEGLAIASLVTSLLGATPAGIVLGFVARRRISKDPETRTGKGLATAGIIAGFALTPLIVLFSVLAANGTFDQKNVDDYSGTEQEIARTIDRFEEAWDNDDGTAVCNELFTESLAAAYQGNCPSEWDDGSWIDMDVESIQVYGNRATVEANDTDVIDWTFQMKYTGGEWRIDDLESD